MFDHIQKRTINKSVKKNKLREQKKVKEDPTKKKKTLLEVIKIDLLIREVKESDFTYNIE